MVQRIDDQHNPNLDDPHLAKLAVAFDRFWIGTLGGNQQLSQSMIAKRRELSREDEKCMIQIMIVGKIKFLLTFIDQKCMRMNPKTTSQ